MKYIKRTLKTGNWKEVVEYKGTSTVVHRRCSVCGKGPMYEKDGDNYYKKYTDYCAYCGARLLMK